MRIGLITGEYPPMQGGVGDFTQELAQALTLLGHEAHVITTSQKSEVRSQKSNQVHRCINNWGWGCWQAIRKVTKELGLDVLNVQYQAAVYHMHPAINFLPIARRWLGLPPLVTTFHDLNVPYLFPKAGSLRRWVVWELARQSDGVIVTNYEDEHQVSSFKFQVSSLERIPIGSNIAPVLPAGYERDEWRARWGVKPGEEVIGYFGFLHPLKGGEILVQALAELIKQGRPAKALFIGGKTGSSDADTNAAYAIQLELLAQALGVDERMAFTRYIMPQEVSAAFYACDVVALPYLEGASLRHGTLMAALAHGRAIVTTRSHTPSPELREGENVLLLPPGDPTALAAGLAQVLDSPTLRARLESGAAELARQFTWDAIAARTVEVYQRSLFRK
ncbi:MAG: glycosyltransferase family 4 protein [Thermoflexales bacterium]|nr:glycosyltransferase family 4 protein [Thermoflexales bacterium]